MDSPRAPLLADLRSLGWDAVRIDAAVAVAASNEQRVRAAALALLAPQDHPASFAHWLDAQALAPDPRDG